MFKGETVTTVSIKNGRPMRDFMFKLTTDILVLKVSIPEGGKRVVSWMNPQNSHKSIKSGNPEGKRVVSWMDQVKSQWPMVVGPVVSQTQAQAQAQAHLAFSIVKTHLEAVYTSDPNGLNESLVFD